MLFVALLATVALASAQSTSTAQNATTFALLYGYPLLSWQQYYAPIVGEVGVNTWRHSRDLSTAANRSVVKPNVDTLYSQLVYDLSQSNVEITFPDVPADDFKLFSFYDPYGDNFANVGTSGFYRAGRYLIRPYDRPGGSSNVGLSGVNDSSSDYVGSVNSASPYGTVLVRWGVNATNQNTVHKWQNECSSQTVAIPKDLTNISYPALESLIDVYDESSSHPENVLSLLSKFAPSNAPITQLKAAGIFGGKYTPIPSVNLFVANAAAVALAMKSAKEPSSNVILNKGWSMTSPDLIGIYGKNYALRAAVAISGYLALRNPFALYPNYSNGTETAASGALTLTADEAILATFSYKPPLQQAGFWSLTAYGGDYYLIPNDQDVYALGDRSNLTLSSGKPVYGDGTDNGTYQILIQPSDVAPPTNWTENWLPAPSGGGEIVPQLRFYGAEQPLIDGAYPYPMLEKIPAITASGGGNSASSRPSTGSAVLNTPTCCMWLLKLVLLFIWLV